MAVIRNENREKFTVVDSNILKNKKLSLKARGMLLTLLSLPDDWEFSENGLEKLFCDGLTAIKSSLKELEKNGYLQRNQIRDKKGKFLQNEWIIYETPVTEKTITENPIMEKPISENDTQLNTNKSNTKKLNIYSPLKEGEESFSGEDKLKIDFNLIWKDYPRKDNKNTAYKHYKSWLKGKTYVGNVEKLENKEMWYAVQIYRYELFKEQKEKQFIKMGSTFFNEAIFEYATKYKDNPIYWDKKIDDWRKGL